VQFFKYKWYKYKLNHTQGQWYEYQHWVDHNKTKIILKKNIFLSILQLFFIKYFESLCYIDESLTEYIFSFFMFILKFQFSRIQLKNFKLVSCVYNITTS
jgi:hypothetical protein